MGINPGRLLKSICRLKLHGKPGKLCILKPKWFQRIPDITEITAHIHTAATKPITASAGTTVQWRYYANDTSGMMYSSDIHSFVVFQDTQPPSWTFNRTNFTSIKTNENGQFNITYEDENALDTILFSYLES